MIFLKNIFVNLATSILMIINKYLVICIYLSIITKVKSYMILLRLLDGKLMTKFIFKYKQKIQLFIKFMTRNFKTLINIINCNIFFFYFVQTTQ